MWRPFRAEPKDKDCLSQRSSPGLPGCKSWAQLVWDLLLGQLLLANGFLCANQTGGMGIGSLISTTTNSGSSDSCLFIQCSLNTPSRKINPKIKEIQGRPVPFSPVWPLMCTEQTHHSQNQSLGRCAQCLLNNAQWLDNQKDCATKEARTKDSE